MVVRSFAKLKNPVRLDFEVEMGFDFGFKAIANRASRRFYFAKGLGLNSPKSKRFSPMTLL